MEAAIKASQRGRPFTIDHTSVPGYVILARVRPGSGSDRIIVEVETVEKFKEGARTLLAERPED
jgi:hypothetical protein